jgi:hypothetical protein
VFEGLQAWMPIIGVLGAAIIAALAASLGSLLVFRRSGQDIQLKTLSAHVETEKLELSQRQFQAQREEMVVEVTHKLGETYSKAFADVNAAYDRLQAEFERQGGRLLVLETETVPGLQTSLAECHARELARVPLDLARDACLERLRQAVQQLGGKVDC